LREASPSCSDVTSLWMLAMLQCPSCLTEMSRGEAPAVHYPPLYQNCQHPVTVPSSQSSLLAQLSSLRVKVLQSKLDQARLEEKLLQTGRWLPARVPPIIDQTEETLQRSRLELLQSCWYYGPLSWQESVLLLQDTKHGTFLVRDSQDSRFMYSLSLQRSKQGPTSVRISFRDGKFSLDAEPTIRRLMPQFLSIGGLISHYSDHCSDCDSRPVSLSPAANIVIRRPLYRHPPSLAHSARLIINKTFKQQSLDKERHLQLPPKLVEYLRSYTLTI